MNILVLEIPSREVNISTPFGTLYISSAMQREGHKVKLIDLTLKIMSLEEICKVVDDFRPQIIGFGGITSSYKQLKNLTIPLKQRYPDILFVAGGVITSIDDLLLEKAAINFCFNGEAEPSIAQFLKAFEAGSDLKQCSGISYLSDSGDIVRRPAVEQVKHLDEIPLPNYSLISIDDYCIKTEDWFKTYLPIAHEHFSDNEISEIIKKAPKLFGIQTSRGCTHKCSFCYRHMKGVRQHSVEYVIKHIKFLIENYGLRFFTICDELTIVTRKWTLDLCSAIKDEGLEIYLIFLSARTSLIDLEMLESLKSVGCLMVNFGYESGSDEVLHAIGKGVSRDDNIRAGLLTRQAGLMNVPEMIINFPNESPSTIKDDISFLKKLGRPMISLNFALPFPHTPLWDYCVENSLIKDKEAYIMSVTDASRLQVNMTKYSDKTLQKWFNLIIYKVKLQNCLRDKDLIGAVSVLIYYKLIVKMPPGFKTSVKNLAGRLSLKR